MKQNTDFSNPMVPVIDIGPLHMANGDKVAVGKAMDSACREHGFFYVQNHGICEDLQSRLEELSKFFFALDENQKMKIRMELGGKAWRGFFPVGGELTSGIPDLKEGLYFGSELNEQHPKVKAGIPMHGSNLFPEGLPDFRSVVLEYMEALTRLGHQLMEGLCLGLGLESNHFNKKYTSDPLTLFRIFHYPAESPETFKKSPWGVGEHTDYGVLTILKQDNSGGLQVKSKSGWIDAPPISGTFVCNIGDMLDRMTGGLYRSTPHRVRNSSGSGRLSYPFFFDPNFDAKIEALPLEYAKKIQDNKNERWDKSSVHDFEGTYGDYVLGKVSKVFPESARNVRSLR